MTYAIITPKIVQKQLDALGKIVIEIEFVSLLYGGLNQGEALEAMQTIAAQARSPLLLKPAMQN